VEALRAPAATRQQPSIGVLAVERSSPASGSEPQRRELFPERGDFRCGAGGLVLREIRWHWNADTDDIE
jgi:hypothetical protein